MTRHDVLFFHHGPMQHMNSCLLTKKNLSGGIIPLIHHVTTSTSPWPLFETMGYCFTVL